MSQKNKDNIKKVYLGDQATPKRINLHSDIQSKKWFHVIDEVNILRVITGVTLCVMSLMILVMSMFGFIRSFLLAAFISMFASVSCMLSLFFLYDLFKNRANEQNLIRESINNAVNNRN